MANHVLLLLLAFSAGLSAYADVFLSIDCGASESYTDENMIVWVGDDLYSQNGETHAVESSNGVSHVMSSLRVFSTRKKNCYSVDVGKGTQVLVRPSFFYGNYDKKNSPPTFDLHFDGNNWANVVTSSELLVSYEAIYVTKGDAVSVCIAQTHPNQLPFISALEVRSLGSKMYSHVDSNYALFRRRRVAFGADKIVRYLNDPYDRIWTPSIIGSNLIKAKSDQILIDINVEDNPPQAVLQNAITTANTSINILLGTNLPSVQVPIYITMFFAEVTELDSTQKRAFTINIDGQAISNPISPPYGKVTEMYVTNVTASSNTSLTLTATTDSTLPPLINAMEVYVISEALADGTNAKDLEGLGALQSGFKGLQDWTGDPCLPSPSTWDWVNCSTDAIPRVTALYLGSFALSGTLPDFSSMDALQTIDLHNNSLEGPIPDFFGALPNLRQLNLADNDFSGPIPSSLSKNSRLKLTTTGNKNLCDSGKSCAVTETGDPSVPSATARGGKKKSNKLPVILGSTIPAFIILWAIVAVCFILHHKRKTALVTAGPPGSGTPNATPVSTTGLESAMRKMGQAAMDEIKVEMKDEHTSDGTDQPDTSHNT